MYKQNAVLTLQSPGTVITTSKAPGFMESQQISVPSSSTQEVSFAGLTFLPLTGTIEGISLHPCAAIASTPRAESADSLCHSLLAFILFPKRRYGGKNLGQTRACGLGTPV